jgi:DNA protecting protein DprA
MSIDVRLRLFNAIEGGSTFWSEELVKFGAEGLVDRLESGAYDKEKKSALRIKEFLLADHVEKLHSEIDSVGARFLTPDSPEWPPLLNDLLAPPFGLIVKGRALPSKAVAIVGTRNPTTYGARVASEFASGFADREWAVISGGAYGIDTHAHRGSITAEGVTCAVLASGVCVNYPSGNEKLFAEIQESGALISEVMPHVRARPERFLTRNRLIAALSLGTIVVEAAFRSGSLRTARDAAEILRIVMAVPGPITSPSSDGCHRLIGERCAEIVTSVSDALELLLPVSSQSTGTLSTDDT